MLISIFCSWILGAVGKLISAPAETVIPMSYDLEAGKLYRMPTHFGPSLGPRQGPDGMGYACENDPRERILSASFEADGAQLESLLPPGFQLTADAEVHVDYVEISEIAWLAGRGYNTFGVSVDAVYEGAEDRVSGRLLLVLWENMADPIITGREELGFSKVYADLSPIRVAGDRLSGHASWDGHDFGALELTGREALDPALLPASESAGTLHYKYLPRTGARGEADAAYATLTPALAPNLRVEAAWRCADARVTFRRSTWQQLPTLVNIVNALAELRLGSCASALCLETRGFKDLSDQRRLR